MRLVRCIKDGKLYAMKTILKSSLDDENKRRSVEIERDILERINHPLIVKMHAYIVNDKSHNFILDFCPGGELYWYIKS